MKRRLFTLMLFLLLGAIVNIAVVVSVSVYASRGSWAKVTYKTLNVSAADAVVLQRAERADPGIRGYKQYEARGFGWRSTMGDSSDQSIKGDDGHYFYLRVFDAGWPLLALQGEWCSGDSTILPQGFHNAWGRYRVVLSGPQAGADSDMLPLKPIWPGFATNTVFYAVVLWLLFAAPFALRRRRRIKRGLCPNCAYPVGASEVCTECGTAVTSRRDARSP